MSKSKQKGTSYETAIVQYAREQGLDAVRLAPAGANDMGDVLMSVPGSNDHWVVEAKNEQQISLASYADEAANEALNYLNDMIDRKRDVIVWHASVIKRRMKPIADSYAVIPLWQLVELLHHVQSARVNHT